MNHRRDCNVKVTARVPLLIRLSSSCFLPSSCYYSSQSTISYRISLERPKTYISVFASAGVVYFSFRAFVDQQHRGNLCPFYRSHKRTYTANKASSGTYVCPRRGGRSNSLPRAGTRVSPLRFVFVAHFPRGRRSLLSQNLDRPARGALS